MGEEQSLAAVQRLDGGHILGKLNAAHPAMTITSNICQNEEVLAAWHEKSWDTLCRQKMPSSRFLVQTDEFSFDEPVHSSSLPCFTTDYFANAQERDPGRVFLPLTDPQAHVTFYAITRKGSALL